MDAWEDAAADKKRGRYNPLVQTESFDADTGALLNALMVRCTDEFETLRTGTADNTYAHVSPPSPELPARTAARLEPNNAQYAELLERMQTGGAYYSPFGGYGSGRVYNCSGGSGRLCLGALAAQMVCMYMRFCCR